MLMTEAKLKKVCRNAFRKTKGKYFHERIISYPEALYQESKANEYLLEVVQDARFIADWVSNTRERYVLDNEVAGAALAVAETRDTSLEKLIPHIRVPHRKLWIEFDERGRHDVAAVAGTYFPHDYSFFPKFTAVMIEAQPCGRRGIMEFCYLDPESAAKLYNVAFEFNLDDPDYNLSGLKDLGRYALPLQLHPLGKSIAGKEIRTYMEYLRAHQGMRCRGRQTVAQTMREMYDRIRNIQDIVGEIRFVIAILGMISMRNGIKTEIAALEPTKGAGSGSLGRRIETQNATEPRMLKMTMSLSHKPERHGSKGGSVQSAAGRHWVCGHFKVRKTGIYWWSPHRRGDSAKDLTETPRQTRIKA